MYGIPIKQNLKTEGNYRFRRYIPSGLKISIEKGDTVTRDSVIASGELLEERKKIDIAEMLSINPRDTRQYLECLHGEMVGKGVIIAKKSARVIRKEETIKSSAHGVVSLDEVQAGFVKILGSAKEVTIEAGVKGEVISAIKNKYVEIETSVTRYRPFGVWGESIQGEIYHINQKQDIGSSLKDSIVVCNFSVDEDLLRKLAFGDVQGVITGSIDMDVFQKIRSENFFGLTIVQTEGFGNLDIEVSIQKVLKENDGALGFIDESEQEVLFTVVGDEKVLSLSQETIKPLEIGMRVQVLSAPYWGIYGNIKEIAGTYVKVYTKEPQEFTIDAHIDNLLAVE